MSEKCKIGVCWMHTSPGFDGFCGVHYVWFLHYKEGKEDCDCPNCVRGRNRIEIDHVVPSDYQITGRKGKQPRYKQPELDLKWIR